jgi:hypothetical protein
MESLKRNKVGVVPEAPITRTSDEMKEEPPNKVKCCGTSQSASCVRGSMWMTALSIVVLVAIGSILVPLGLQNREKANHMEPTVDFTAIEPGCNVTEAVHVKFIQKWCEVRKGSASHKCGCDDRFFYLFSAPQLASINDFYLGTGDNYVYQSIEYDSNRGDSVYDCIAGRKQPLFEAGDVVPCWRPSEPGSEIKEGYRCGNDECIKIIDPKDDKNAITGKAQAMWIGSVATFGLAVVMVGAFFYAKSILSKRKRVHGTAPKS